MFLTVTLFHCSLFVDTGGLDTETDAASDGTVEASKDASPDVANDVANDVADGGVDADAAVDGACPSWAAPVGDAGYCIGKTEVSRADYATFLATNPSIAGQLAECSWNGTYVPGTWDSSQGTLPVVYVDWCDAYAYCKWAGGRLCGKIGGGTLSFSTPTDANVSQWYRACSGNNGLAYPYGNNYMLSSCNAATPDASVAPVGSFTQCAGGFPGIFDMSGNVEEWQDACDGTTGASDRCRDQAGAFDYSTGDPVASSRCDFTDSDLRNAQYGDVGIRCCYP